MPQICGSVNTTRRDSFRGVADASGVSANVTRMSSPETSASPDQATRIRRNITAELARHGMTPNAGVVEITGLSPDTVTRRLKAGDWRIGELTTLAERLELSGVDALLK